MAWAVVPTAVTGDIVPAAWGNRVRDNSAYLKGQAGSITLENSLTVSGTITSTSSISAPGAIAAGPGAAAQITIYDRTTNNPWVLYGSGGLLRVYDGSTGAEPIQFVQGTAMMNWSSVNDPDSGIPPTRLRRVTRVGMLGAGGGTQSINYNGDGTVDWIFFPDGISATSTITFEYSGGRCVAVRLRIGGSTGTIINSIGFGYDGQGRVNAIGQS